ncbi:MAG: type II toxin-antitoxin system HicB family antitoxin [Rhodomicrobium sp.]
MTANYTFSVILEPAEEGGFVVHVPALPEICTEGDTEDEALAMAKDAIELVIESRLERGEPVPAEFQKPIMRQVTVSPAV